MAESEAERAVPKTSSDAADNAKATLFSVAVSILKELLINKVLQVYVGSYFWITFLGTEGSEISQMCPVKRWNHLINYFEYIGDFPSDVLQWGMYADGLLLHIYSCSQGGKDCLGHMEVMVYVHLNSLGVLHGRNLVLLAGKLKQWPFHSTVSLLFVSPRNTLNSPWRSPQSCGFAEEWGGAETLGARGWCSSRLAWRLVSLCMLTFVPLALPCLRASL